MRTEVTPWYSIAEISRLDTPALVIYRNRVTANIAEVKRLVTADALRPHVKTHKSMEVTQLLLDEGIRKFKCATIAEAEMLALAKVADVLLAYQPVGPKLLRFIGLMQKYPGTSFSCLVDDRDAAKEMAHTAAAANVNCAVYVDLNVGMNRSGIVPELAFSLIEEITKLPQIRLLGLHAYDGHVDDPDITKRNAQCEAIYQRVSRLADQVIEAGGPALKLVMGGSPTFAYYAQYPEVECSPGTFVFWDNNYLKIAPEQQFVPAALVIGRVVSMPTPETLTVDIGHKAVAAERPVEQRIRFLNAPDLVPVSQSEEHLVVRTAAGHSYCIGMVLYGLPGHICPTCALYQDAALIDDHKIASYWTIDARNRKISV